MLVPAPPATKNTYYPTTTILSALTNWQGVILRDNHILRSLCLKSKLARIIGIIRAMSEKEITIEEYGVHEPSILFKVRYFLRI